MAEARDCNKGRIAFAIEVIQRTETVPIFYLEIKRVGRMNTDFYFASQNKQIAICIMMPNDMWMNGASQRSSSVLLFADAINFYYSWFTFQIIVYLFTYEMRD